MLYSVQKESQNFIISLFLSTIRLGLGVVRLVCQLWYLYVWSVHTLLIPREKPWLYCFRNHLLPQSQERCLNPLVMSESLNLSASTLMSASRWKLTSVKIMLSVYSNYTFMLTRLIWKIRLFLIRSEWMSAEVHNIEMNGCTVARHDHDVHDSSCIEVVLHRSRCWVMIELPLIVLFKYDSHAATCYLTSSWDVVEFISGVYHLSNTDSINVTAKPRLCDKHNRLCDKHNRFWDKHDAVVLHHDVMNIRQFC